jgi:hypothetical protein
MGAADTYNDIDLAWLMRLRIVVARLGEMDQLCEEGAHLRHLLRSYATYHNAPRTHLSFQSTRTRRRREQYMPLVAFWLSHFLADFIICMCEFDFRQAQLALTILGLISFGLVEILEQFAMPHREPASGSSGTM